MTDAPPSPADPDGFRRAISRWASGVAVVTGRRDGADHGMTVNSLTSIALRPPTLLVSLAIAADSTPEIEATGQFGVSLLSADQRALSERFALAIPSAEKFAGVGVHRAPSGVALLDGALAGFDCRVDCSIPVADHHLLIGTVMAVELGSDDLPLSFYRSRYGERAGPETLRLPPRT